MKMLKTETAAIAIAVFLTNSMLGGVLFKSIQISLEHSIFYAVQRRLPRVLHKKQLKRFINKTIAYMPLLGESAYLLTNMRFISFDVFVQIK